MSTNSDHQRLLVLLGELDALKNQKKETNKDFSDQIKGLEKDVRDLRLALIGAVEEV